MIKRLRNKFILINMLLVTVVLLIGFIGMMISSYNLYRKESHDELIHAIDSISYRSTEPDSNVPPSTKSPSSKKPVSTSKPASSSRPELNDKKPSTKRSTVDIFTVIINPETNEIISTDTQEFAINDEDLNIAVTEAINTGDDSGIIHSVAVRYMKRSSFQGDIYAFADMTHEITALRQQALVMLVAGISGLLIFFFISLILSNIAMRPTVESYNTQKQFIADASHELRTPLTVILANTSILLKGDVSSDQKKWLDTTYSESIRMKHLLDDMLFLARSDSDQIVVEKETFDFSNLICISVLPFESILLEKDVSLSTDEISPDVKLFACEPQIKQLVSILLDNACKYVNHGGKVTISLSDTDNKIVFKINNTGSVIDKSDLPHIFERFYRGDKMRTYTTVGGHGLGLSILDYIAKQNKAKVAVTSNEKDGTTFTITFTSISK